MRTGHLYAENVQEIALEAARKIADTDKKKLVINVVNELLGQLSDGQTRCIDREGKLDLGGQPPFQRCVVGHCSDMPCIFCFKAATHTKHVL